MRKAKMGGGMMKRDVAMKKGGKIPPQLKKFVMAKKKKAAMKKEEGVMADPKVGTGKKPKGLDVDFIRTKIQEIPSV